ncbi:MAG TPA: hypothetical protein DDX92_02730 [Flavobacteriales bacterium]|jgi:hypothetical protein|nr:hypothetical protein [Flavobacteriales bacterium]
MSWIISEIRQLYEDRFANMRFTFLFALLIHVFTGISQYDTTVSFRAPLTIPMYLSGNYGEIRSGHFHAGIDIKTNQTEGWPVIAAEDGYISRIKISLSGYGKVLYINHPNGYTTVYGHLQKFNKGINDYIKVHQYRVKSFTVEQFPYTDALKVKKGDTIAWSGNTGGSGGPHLHFEIRETKSGVPLNPLRFGFDIRDDIDPLFKNIGVYPLNDTSIVNGKNKPFIFKYSGVTSIPDIRARGKIGFGVEAIDKMNGTGNRCGVYEISLSVDSHEIYRHEMDFIPFQLTRYIQAHVDYYEWSKNKRRIQRSFIDRRNQLPIYKHLTDSGAVIISDSQREIMYKIKDVYGNQDSVKFRIRPDSSTLILDSTTDSTSIPILADKPYTFKTQNIQIEFPEQAFYSDVMFSYRMRDTLENGVSAIHEIQNLFTPLHKYMTVSIRTPDVSDKEGSSFIGVSLNRKDKILAVEGGNYHDGWVTFKTRSLGPYMIARDTLAPKITPISGASNDIHLVNNQEVKFKLTDNLSGIKFYRAEIDGKWALLEYDKKTGMAIYNADADRLKPGKHQFSLYIEDAVHNSASYSFIFIW